MKRVWCTLLGLALFLGTGVIWAQPGAPVPDVSPAPLPDVSPAPKEAEPAPLPAEPQIPEALQKADDIYKRYLRHFLPRQATEILDSVVDLATLYYTLPALWQTVKEDPVLGAIWQQLKLQYKPTIYWSAYAGGVGESTGYAGLSAGAAVDITAPLCRYLGAAANTLGYYQDGAGLSYDTRGTVCLPWGPFSIEFGLLSQRELRVGISSAPSLPNSRFNADGFELRIRSYRWIDRKWEAQFSPMDLIYRSYSVPGDTSLPTSAAFQVEVSGFRYLRYGRGFLGADRRIDAIHADVVGQEDTQLANMSTTVMTVSPVKWTGARLAEDLYLDGYAGFSQGRITNLNAPEVPLEDLFFFATGFQLDKGNAERQASLRYRRRLVPDSDFRLLSEDRIDLSGQLLRQFDLTSLSVYGAMTKQVAAPAGTPALLRTPSYGVEAKYGRFFIGPFYLQLTATAARSYYASIDGARLLSPELEFRGLASLIASDSNY